MSKSFSTAPRILVVGDFNDLSKYFDTISSLSGLCSAVSFPTRGDRILDQLFSNFNDLYSPPEKLSPIGRSDHCSILWGPVLSRSKICKVQIRHFSKSACAKFYDAINKVNWNTFFNNELSLETVVGDFYNCVKYFFDLNFVLKTVRVREFEPPWMSYSLKLLINDCDRAFWKGNKARFVRLRNAMLQQIRYLKGKFLRKAVESGDARKMWDVVNSLSRRKAKGDSCCIPVGDLNEYFVSHVQKNKDSLVISDILLNGLPSCSLSFSCAEVKKCLRKMNKASCGRDGIPLWIFRNSSCCFSWYLFPLASKVQISYL